MFRDGGVLAIAAERPPQVIGNQFPADLERQGSPAELFNAWFQLVTTDQPN
jgi:hypothetical protein